MAGTAGVVVVAGVAGVAEFAGGVVAAGAGGVVTIGAAGSVTGTSAEASAGGSAGVVVAGVVCVLSGVVVVVASVVSPSGASAEICVGGAETASPGIGGGGLSAPAPTRLLPSVPVARPAAHNATAMRKRLARCMVLPSARAFIRVGPRSCWVRSPGGATWPAIGGQAEDLDCSPQPTE